MAVSELEQRYVPLIESQSVWQPWGPAGRYPLEDGCDGASRAPRTHPGSWQRSHSWGGYTTDAQRERFQADPLQPSQGATPGLRLLREDESDRADDAVLCTDVYPRQVADPSPCGSGEGLADGEGPAPSQCAAIGAQEQISHAWSELPLTPDREGCGHLPRCRARRDAGGVAAGPAVYESSGKNSDSELGLDALKSQWSSELPGTSHPSENSWADSWENSPDGPGSDDQWPPPGSSSLQASRRGGAPPALHEVEDLYHPGTDQPSSPSDASPSKPGRKPSRQPHRAGKAKSSSEAVPAEVTTLMVQNLPYSLSRADLLCELERSGFGELFNFCHVPRTFATGKNQGVAFVNFLSPEIAERFARQWHGNRSLLGMSPFGKALRVKVAAVQGIEACERIAQSRRMKRVKTGTFKPLIISGQVPQSP